MMKRNRKWLFLSLLVVVALGFTACLGGGGGDGVVTHLLNMDRVGEGDVEPGVGEHQKDNESVVTLKADPAEGWEFYAWDGSDADGVADRFSAETTLKMDRDRSITVVFGDTFFDPNFQEISFLGGTGQIVDVTDNPPYPPGFMVELEAVADSENDQFLSWAVEFPNAGSANIGPMGEGVDPREYFENYESPNTRFTVPEQEAIVRAYFTSTTPPNPFGEFDFDVTDFEITKSGDQGFTRHYWDLSDMEDGAELSFYFHARNLPDRFRVYYDYADQEAAWDDPERIFDSGWVSLNPPMYEDPSLYPEGVEEHDWHEDVELSNVLTFNGQPGGHFPGIVIKEPDKDLLVVEVEGRDNGTIWDYQLRGLPAN